MAFDAKADLLKALNEAKKAGLPTSIKDVDFQKHSIANKELGFALEKATKILFRYEKRRQQLIKDHSNAAVMKNSTAFGDLVRDDQIIKGIDHELLSVANTIIHNNLRPSYGISERKVKGPEPILRAFIRVKMDSATRDAEAGNLSGVVKSLLEARRLPPLTLRDSTYMSTFMVTSLERSYYQYLLKLVEKVPSIGVKLPYNVVAPMTKPGPKEVIRGEFISSIVNGPYSLGPMVAVPGFPAAKMPKDSAEQSFFANEIRNFTAVYRKCGKASGYSEATRLYRTIEKNLEHVTSGGEKFVLGPNWMNLLGSFDKMLLVRDEVIKKIGIKKPN